MVKFMILMKKMELARGLQYIEQVKRIPHRRRLLPRRRDIPLPRSRRHFSSQGFALGAVTSFPRSRRFFLSYNLRKTPWFAKPLGASMRTVR